VTVPVPAPLPAQRRRRRITRETRATFLEAISGGYALTHAADLTGVDRRRWYELKRDDPTFAAEFRLALETRTELVEQELWRRGVLGFDEVTRDADGAVIRVVHRYDTPALLALHRIGRPEAYGQRVEITGRGGGPVELTAARERLVSRIAGIAERSELSPDGAGE
jgi:hypothetical protein